MELKLYTGLSARRFGSSFNRTAYGIEIGLPVPCLLVFAAFNRTAYGIEIIYPLSCVDLS